MKNGYCRLSHLRQAVSAEGTTSQDDALLAARDAASRMVEQITGRRFYSEIATAEYDGTGTRTLWLALHAAEPFRGDLIAPTTVKVDNNGDGTFELTLVENTDYWMHPDNPTVHNRPAERLDVVTGRIATQQVYVWPCARRSVQVVGKFGHSEITELAGTLGAAISSTSATAVTMTAGHTVEEGDNIFIDTEELYVSDVSSNALTVVRGINGTTAATHLISVAVNVRRYPEDIERAVRADASRWLWRAARGEYEQAGMPWAAIREAAASYGKGGVGAGLAVG